MRLARMTNPNDRAVLDSIFDPLYSVGQSCDDLPDETSGVSQKSDDPAIQEMELEGVQLADGGELDEAIAKFTRLIQMDPRRASSYNNRAQAYRLRGDTALAEEDLGKAIELGGKRKHETGCAYTQRAMLRQLRNDEGGALGDYKEAAARGNQFAKQQVVNLNPTAKLCNQMMLEMLRKTQEPTNPGN